MKLKHKSAKELCEGHPGSYERRIRYIVALCSGLKWVNAENAEEFGSNIVRVANKIIEETEQ